MGTFLWDSGVSGASVKEANGGGGACGELG